MVDKSGLDDGWLMVYKTYAFMEAELIEAKLRDSEIEYQVLNKADIGYTMEVGNSLLGRQAVGHPIKFFVKLEDAEKTKMIINEDKSELLDNPDLEF